MTKVDNIFDYLEVIPDIPDDDRGKEYKAKCICGGELTAYRSIYNGHLHVECDKCKFTLHE